ncbi:hypothetical protein D3C79_614420 [compost metagenome]
MMLKRWVIILGVLFPLLSCAADVPLKPFSWRYGTGSNIDSFCTTKAEFYRKNKMVAGYPGGGAMPAPRINTSSIKCTTGQEGGGYLQTEFLCQIKP